MQKKEILEAFLAEQVRKNENNLKKILGKARKLKENGDLNGHCNLITGTRNTQDLGSINK
jgi:hypothetical protein